jgi:TonB family protein
VTEAGWLPGSGPGIMALMTNRRIAAIVIITVAGAGPFARAQAPAPSSAQSPAPSPPASPAPAPQAPAPPADGVYQLSRDRVAPPRVISEVKPGYTPEAMRNRIQGRVRLQGIVERDGTISGITVVQSLDSQFGLDQAAVDALKQWRFQPGTLVDGTPVRVLINVELTFTLRDSRPIDGWPEGFADPAPAPGAVEEVAGTERLRLRISRPPAWIATSGSASTLVGFHSADGTRTIGVFRPDTPAFDLSGVPPDAQVQRLFEKMRQFLPAAAVDAFTTGQVQPSPDVRWVWSAFRVPSVSSLPGVPRNDLIGEAREWLFARTTANGTVLLVQCTLLLPRDLDPAALASRVQQAAADFAPIIRSISVEAIAN